MPKLNRRRDPASADQVERGRAQDSRTGSLTRAVATTYGATVAAAALSLTNVLITARSLGPTGRGELAFLTTIALLTATLSSFGVEEANGNLAGLQPGARPALATNSLLLSLVLGGIGIAAVSGLVALAPGVGGSASRTLLVLALVAIPVLIFQVYLQFLIRADYGFAITNIGSVVAPVLTLAVNATMAVKGNLTVGRALGEWVVGQFLVTALLAAYVRARLAGFGRPRLRLAGSAVRFGLLAHAGRVMKTGNYRLDQWLLGSLADLRLLAPGAFVIIALKLLANSLTAQRKPMLGNIAVAVAFAATVALDLLLIPRYGGAGAAAASTVAYSAGGVAVAIIFCRAFGTRLRELLPRPVTDTRTVVGRVRAALSRP